MIDTQVRPSEWSSTDQPQSGLNPTGTPAFTLDSLKIVTFPARIFLALGWLRAGTEKLIDVNWWTGSELEHFLTLQRSQALPFMHPLIDRVFAPAAIIVAVLVLASQFAIGAALITGRRLQAAICLGMVLNVVFVAMGAVTPSAFYLVLQLTLLAALGQRSTRSPRLASRWIRLGVCLAVAAAMLPLVGTLHPSEVIEDPALMLATIALLGASVDGLQILQARLDALHNEALGL